MENSIGFRGMKDTCSYETGLLTSVDTCVDIMCSSLSQKYIDVLLIVPQKYHCNVLKNKNLYVSHFFSTTCIKIAQNIYRNLL